MKIHDRIYVVGGGDNSFGLTDKLDCTVYLVDGKDELALIDSGAGVASELILEEVKKHGFEISKIKYILLTHAHADHCGGAGILAEKCGAVVFAAKDSARFLCMNDLEAMSIGPALNSGVYPKGYVVKFCTPQVLEDGDEIKIGDLTLTMIDLPGHSDGHCGYYMEYGGKKILFSGDLAFGKAKISMQATWDCRFQPYMSSLRRVRDMNIDSLLTGHQAFCMNGAYRIFERLLNNGTGMPANL